MGRDVGVGVVGERCRRPHLVTSAAPVTALPATCAAACGGAMLKRWTGGQQAMALVPVLHRRPIGNEGMKGGVIYMGRKDAVNTTITTPDRTVKHGDGVELMLGKRHRQRTTGAAVASRRRRRRTGRNRVPNPSRFIIQPAVVGLGGINTKIGKKKRTRFMSGDPGRESTYALASHLPKRSSLYHSQPLPSRCKPGRIQKDAPADSPGLKPARERAKAIG